MIWRLPIGFSLVALLLLSFISPCYAADKGMLKAKTPATNRPPETVHTPSSSSPGPTSIPPPIGMRVEQHARDVYLVLTRPAEVNVYLRGKRVHTCPHGLQCNITTAVAKANNGALTFVCRDSANVTTKKTLPVGQYAHLFQGVEKQPGVPFKKISPPLTRAKQAPLPTTPPSAQSRREKAVTPLAAKPGGIVPSAPVLRHEDYGIRIVRPSSSETIRLGAPLVVAYDFSQSVDAGKTTFRLYCNDAVVATTMRQDDAHRRKGPESGAVRLTGELRRFTWDIPDDLRTEEPCLIEAVHGDARGLSAPFLFSPLADIVTPPLVELIDPGGDEWWECGTVQTVKWRIYFSEDISRIGAWRFAIHREGEPYGAAYPIRDCTARPIRPGVVEYTWNWHIPGDIPLGDNYIARIEALPPAGSAHAGFVDESDRTFRIRTRRAHDLEVTDIRLDDRDHVIAEITEHEGPFTGNVPIRIERGHYHRTTDNVDVWEALSSATRTLTLGLIGGERVSVDLGAAVLPVVDLGLSCGLFYRITVDADNWVGERNEVNNDRTEELYFRRDSGQIKIVEALNADWSVLSWLNRTIAYRYFNINPRRSTRDGVQQVPDLILVDVKNCSRHPVSGTVRIVQTLYPGAALAQHAVTVVDEYHTIDPGQRRTFGVRQWYIARDCEIAVHFDGDIAAWAPGNPFTITVDRRD